MDYKIKYLNPHTIYEIVTEDNDKYRRIGPGKWEEINGFHLHCVMDEDKIKELEEMLRQYVKNLSGEK